MQFVARWTSVLPLVVLFTRSRVNALPPLIPPPTSLPPLPPQPAETFWLCCGESADSFKAGRRVEARVRTVGEQVGGEREC